MQEVVKRRLGFGGHIQSPGDLGLREPQGNEVEFENAEAAFIITIGSHSMGDEFSVSSPPIHSPVPQGVTEWLSVAPQSI